MPLLEVKDLHLGLTPRGGEPVDILRGVSFSVDRGGRVGLVGESGCGKSVTAAAILRLLRPPLEVRSGEISLDGTDLLSLSEREMTKVRGAKAALVDQNPLSALNPVQRIGTQLVEAIRLHRDLSKSEAEKRAVELLGEVRIPEPAERIGAYPHEFSGGMRQRVMIAMALSSEPGLLIADEPTTALDVTTQARIIEMLTELADEREMAVLLITHDLGVAAGFCQEIQVMYAGRVVERAAVDAFYQRPVHPYSEALLSAICDLELPLDEPIKAIGGRPPLPGELEGVCTFSPRCPYAEDVCRRESPALVAVPDAVAACHFANDRAATAKRRPENEHEHARS
jgi:peptide/nickel transport system ATP-binding protein